MYNRTAPAAIVGDTERWNNCHNRNTVLIIGCRKGHFRDRWISAINNQLFMSTDTHFSNEQSTLNFSGEKSQDVLSVASNRRKVAYLERATIVDHTHRTTCISP